MSEPKWDDTEELPPAWDDTAEIAEPEKYSQSEAAMRAAAQMATFGHSDEMIAGVQSMYKDEDYDELVKTQRERVRGSAEQWPKTDLGAPTP